MRFLYSIKTQNVIELGRAGENLARVIRIDVASMFDEWPDAQIAVVAKRPSESTPYAVENKVIDGCVYWHVSAADVAIPGFGAVEIRAMRGEQLMKSAILTSRVLPSITGPVDPVPPESEQGWVDKVIAAGTNAVAAAERAEEATDQADSAAKSANASADRAQNANARAQTAQTNAQQYAQNAADSAQTASSAATVAQSAQTNAESSATLATNAKSAAEISAQNAADSANQAADSKTAAESAAGRAEQAADVAGEIMNDAVISDAKTWSSKHIVDMFCPPLEATGNPVQCYPVAGYPLGVKVAWEPRQEGSGDPSPDNVRPIVGLDSVQVTRCGKNVLDESKLRIQSNYDTSQEAFGFWYYELNLPFGSYTVSAGATYNGGGYLWVGNALYGDSDATGVWIAHGSVKLSTNFTFNDVDKLYIGVSGNMELVTSVLDAVQFIQIEAGSTPTAYAPYTGTTATLTLPETIYGGTVDAVTGEGSDQYIYRELAISDMNNSEAYPGWNNVPWINDVKHNPAPNGNFATLGIHGVTSIADVSQGSFWHSNGTQVYTLPVFWGGKTQSQIKEAYPDLVVQFCLRLVTPTPFQATGNASIPALPGTNTIYTDADSVTVTGRKNPVAALNDLSARLSARLSAIETQQSNF